MFKKVELQELKNLDALSKFKSEYSDILVGTCWGCPNSLEAAVNKVNSLKYIPMLNRMKRYERIPVKGPNASPTYKVHYFMGKAVAGLPGTVTPNNETDEIIDLIKKHHPKIYESTYRELSKEELIAKDQRAKLDEETRKKEAEKSKEAKK